MSCGWGALFLLSQLVDLPGRIGVHKRDAKSNRKIWPYRAVRPNRIKTLRTRVFEKINAVGKERDGSTRQGYGEFNPEIGEVEDRGETYGPPHGSFIAGYHFMYSR